MFAMLTLATVATSALVADKIDFYIGTYTSRDGSKGIYHAQLDAATGKLSAPTLVAETSSPSYLAAHPKKAFLYAVDESSKGAVGAFAILPDHQLKFINVQTGLAGGPCHVSVDPSGRSLFIAGYGGGALAAFPLKGDGSIGAASFEYQNHGTGPDRSRQEAPHLHWIAADPKGKFVYACDLGTDEVLAFHLDPAKALLTAAQPPSVKVPAGGGARHLAFHPSGKFAFVCNEMQSSVTAFKIDPATGSMTETETLPTLASHVEGNSTAEIACTPNGKFLFVSNRGHDSIASFRIAGNGHLTPIEIKQVGVKTPRGFGIDPSGKWLVVAGQNSNDLRSFGIDPVSGKLKGTGSKISVSKPVCVTFLPK